MDVEILHSSSFIDAEVFNIDILSAQELGQEVPGDAGGVGFIGRLELSSSLRVDGLLFYVHCVRLINYNLI